MQETMRSLSASQRQDRQLMEALVDLGQMLADAIVRTHGENAAKWIKPDVDGGLTLDGKFDLKTIAEAFSIALRRAEKDNTVEATSPVPNQGIEV